MKTLGPFDDRTDWLEARRGGIGSSDIAAIVGVSPWGTPWSVYVDKVGAVDLDDEGTEAMAWGRILEDTILDQWEERTGLFANNRQTLAVHDTHEWARVTVDALAWESHHPTGTPNGALYPLEVKVSSDWRWDEIPLHYQAQGQWQMLVTGFDRVEFVVLHSARRLETYTLKADHDDQQALVAAGEAFWRDHVESEVPPPVSGEDNKALNSVYPQHLEAEVDIEVDLVRELVAVKAEQKTLEARRDDLEARIKDTLREAEVGVDETGEKIVSWKTQPANRFDSKRLKADKPDIYEAYMPTDRTTRVLRTHLREGTKHE